MVTPTPGLQGSHHAGNALLANLHAPADTAVLQGGRLHQRPAARHNATGGTTQKFVTAVDHQVSAAGQKSTQVVL